MKTVLALAVMLVAMTVTFTAAAAPDGAHWLLNVNIPNRPYEELKPFKVCRLGRRHGRRRHLRLAGPLAGPVERPVRILQTSRRGGAVVRADLQKHFERYA